MPCHNNFNEDCYPCLSTGIEMWCLFGVALVHALQIPEVVDWTKTAALDPEIMENPNILSDATLDGPWKYTFIIT